MWILAFVGLAIIGVILCDKLETRDEEMRQRHEEMVNALRRK